MGSTTVPFSTYLTDFSSACLTPADRVGFDCFAVQDGDNVDPNTNVAATASVALIVGPNTSSTWQLEWEAVVLDRVAGGSVTVDGALNDPEVDFTLTVLPDDFLQIFTPASISDSDCKDALDNDPIYTDDVHKLGVVDTDLCLVERRIISVQKNQLVLENPLPHPKPDQIGKVPDGAPCYPSAGEIAYKVRMGRQYQVTSAGFSERLGIDSGKTTWGPAGFSGAASPVIFSLQELSLVYPAQSGDPWDACRVLPAAAADVHHRFGRDLPFAFSVTSGFSPLTSGVQPADTATAAGYLPGAMIAAPRKNAASDPDAWSGNYPPVFLSYSGSNAILGFVPYDLNNLFTGDHYVEIN